MTSADVQEQVLAQGQDFVDYIRLIGETLSAAFSQIGPAKIIVTAISRTEGAGWGLSFAVIWGDVDPVSSKHLAAAVRGFDGKLAWSAAEEFNNRGVRVSALPKDLANTSVHSSSVSEAELVEEIIAFARHIRRQIDLQAIRTTGNSYVIHHEHAYGDSAYDVYLVRAPEAFDYNAKTFDLVPTSLDDVRICVAILNDDLSALSVELQEGHVAISAAGSDLISRLLDRHLRITIKSADIGRLGQFLDDLLSNLRNGRSRRVVQCLGRIIKEAADRGLSLVLEPTK